jgi:hypothetical protein
LQKLVATNNDLKEIALGACAVVIMSLVLIIVGLAYTLESYQPDNAKLTFPPLWQAAYGQEQEQPVASNDLCKEVAAIKAQLLLLVSRLDHVEQEIED